MTIRYGDRTELGNAVTNWGRGGGGFAGVVATGGTVASPGDGYKYHTFTSPGTFSVTDIGANGEIDVLLVAGGGGGGNGPYAPTKQVNGGGGGGGLIVAPITVSASPGSYPVTVGAGGAVNTSGNDTTGFGLTAKGGGRGRFPTGAAARGGSPGGVYDNEPVIEVLSNPTGNYGGNGGNLYQIQPAVPIPVAFIAQAAGGGGGGAGAAAVGPAGGVGKTVWGTAYAGGGAGGGTFFVYPGGTGGGGNAGVAGTQGLGGGGGGGRGDSPTYPGGAGGDGVVVVRYWIGK